MRVLGCVILLFIVGVSFAQIPDQFNFFKIDSAFIDTMSSKSSYSDFETRLLKRHQRWLSFWYPRISNGDSANYGDLRIASEKMYQFYIGQQQGNCNSDSPYSNWSYACPTSVIRSHNPMHGKGIITSIAVHPTNRNIIYAGSNSGGVFKTIDGGETWTNISDNMIPSCGVQCIAIDPVSPNILFIATGLSTYGESVFYGYYGIGILKSTDGGNSWQETPLTSAKNRLSYKIIIDENHHNNIYALINDTVYRSRNGGVNWQRIFCLPRQDITKQVQFFRDIEILPSDSNTILVTADDRNADDGGAKIYICENALSLQPVFSEVTSFANSLNSENIGIATTSVNQNQFYICYNDKVNSIAHIYAFNPITNGVSEIYSGSDIYLVSQSRGIGFWMLTFEASRTNGDVFYIGGTVLNKLELHNNEFAVHNLTDYNTFEVPHCDKRAFQSYSENGEDVLIEGDDGGIAKSSDGGTTWVNINGIGLDNSQIFGIDVSNKAKNSFLLCGTQDNSIYRIFNDDVGDNEATGDYYNPIINDYDSSQQFISYATSTPPALMQNYKFDIVAGVPHYFWAGLSSIHYVPYTTTRPAQTPFDQSSGYLYTGYNLVYRSGQYDWYDYVSHPWRNITGSLMPTNQTISDISPSPSNPDVVYVAYEFPIYHGGSTPVPRLFKCSNATSDSGPYNWTDFTEVVPEIVSWFGISDIEVDPNDQDRFWVSFDGYPENEGLYRVYQFDLLNGNYTVTDISEGLPAFPVSKIVCQRGLNENDIVLYAATDVGVYYYRLIDGQGGVWNCFRNNDMPYVIVSDIEIDYCDNTMYASTFGRGIWQTALPDFYNAPFEINNSTAWNTDHEIFRDILVKSGSIFTIENCNVSLSGKIKITVEPGGKLIVDNAFLKSFCSENWQGIELRGDGSESQLTLGAQGEVEIINGGTIENALCGIYVGERDGNGNLLPNTGGGIVKATGGVFKNCVEGVHYTPYKNFNPNDPNHPEIINSGWFTNCTFTTDDDYYGMTSMLPKSFMTLKGIKGMRLKGNTFQNTADDAIPGQERGNGITSHDATYYLQPGCQNQTAPCTLPDPNEFEKLHYAIYAANTNPLNPIYVKDNVFEDNFRAMRIMGMKGAAITGNTIDIGKSTGPMVHNSYWDDAYGIHLEGCSGYQIQENNFTTDDDGRYGIIISNSGPNANLLNNNTFTGLLIACQAEGINGSEPYCAAGMGNINTGLLFKCNEYSGNTLTDINVTSGLIDVEQGLCTDTYSPAGNTFANYGSLGNLWANSGVTPYRYNYHEAGVTAPYVINPIAAPHSCDVTYSSQSCALPYGNYTIQELQQTINTNVEALANMKRKIDGGNTQYVLDYIAAKPEGGDLLNLLNEELAPYVSDEVLIKTIFYHDTISDAQLANVIIANSPVTESVMDMLNKINLDANSREIIINAQVGVSARFLLEDSINNAQAALDFAANELLLILMSDTSLTGAGIISEYYNEIPDSTNFLKIIAAEAFLISEERESAQTVLDAIVSDDPEITNSVEYLEILCDTNNVWDTVVNLTTAQQQSLENIALSGTRVAYNAKALLEIALDTVYDEVIEGIEIADSLTISGHLHESSNCSNNAVAGDTLLIKSPQGMIYTKVSPAVTDSNGYFEFNPMELSLLNDTVEFTISTKNSFSVDAAGTGTRADWIGQSPLHLTLEKLYRSWKYDYENVKEMMAVSKSVALADQVYVAGSMFNPSTESIDAVLLKLDTAGNLLWNVYYDGEGGNNKVMDFYVDDSLKIYLLIFTEVENEPLTEIVAYDSSGNLKWSVQSEYIKAGRQIMGNNDGYIYVGGDATLTDNQYSYLYRYTDTGLVDWYSTFEETNTPFEFSTSAMLNDTVLVVICIDYSDKESYVYTINADDGSKLNDFKLGDFFAFNLLSDDAGNIFLSGNNPDGNKVFSMKINTINEVVWQNDEESEIIATAPGCFVMDTSGNTAVLYYNNVGFGIAGYDDEGTEIWSEDETGDWFSEIDRLLLKTDAEGNLYTLLASHNFEQGGFRSYIYKHNTAGEKQWEQMIDYSQLYDFAVSENGNIYTSGSLYLAENEYSLSTYKYAQCYITANLRSAEDSTTTENISETYVKLYPNPNDGSMQLEYLLPENLSGVFELYDLTGRMVYSLMLQESSGVKSISAHHLNRGVYMYRVGSGDKTVDMGKVVVIK